MLKRSLGYSLVSVLVATAIVSIALSGVLYVVDMIASTVARSNAEDNVEAAVKTVQGIVANRDLCNNALRGANAADKVEFNPVGCAASTVPIPRVYLQRQDNEANATLVLSNGGAVGFGSRVDQMFLRERVPCQGRGQVRIGTVNMTTYATELVIVFGGDGSGRTTGGMRSRSVPISVVTHPGPDGVPATGDDYIDRCYQDSSSQYLCEQLGGSYTAGGGCRAVLQATDVDCRQQLAGRPEDCPDSEPNVDVPNNVRCQNFYYVVGFQNDPANPDRPNSRPICRCQRICRMGTGTGSGGAGPGAGPGPGPGPGAGPGGGPGGGGSAN